MAFSRMVWGPLAQGACVAGSALPASASSSSASSTAAVLRACLGRASAAGAGAQAQQVPAHPMATAAQHMIQRVASGGASQAPATLLSDSMVVRMLLRHTVSNATPASLGSSLRAASSKHSTPLRGFASSASTSTSSGASGSGGPIPRNILEHAAEAQMQKLKTKPDPAHHQPQEPPGVLSRVLGVLVDAAALGIGGFLLFAGYYTLAYPDTADLDASLKNAQLSLDLAAAGVPLSGATGAGEGGAGAPVTAAPKPSGMAAALPPPPSAVQPASLPPVTKAWCYVMDRYLGIRRYVEKSIRDFRDPTYHKLLPDMAPELKGRIKTLVLDLDDLLVHKEWTRQYGWKIYKRPGVQDFLLEMGGYYELVIFTDTPATYAEPIITKLDPHRVVLYRLYRPETQYHNGKHVRDLSKLNRDLSQVLMISCNPEAWEFQPENTLKLKPWHHAEATDTTLLDLIPMLQLIATKGIRDVRDVVKSYDGQEDIPRAFKERMAQVAGQQKQPQKRGLLGSIAK